MAIFTYDQIEWEIDGSFIDGKSCLSPKIPMFHPLYKDPLTYLSMLSNLSGFAAMIGYYTGGYAWDISPSIHYEKDLRDRYKITYRNLNNPSVEIGLIQDSEKFKSKPIELRVPSVGPILFSKNNSDSKLRADVVRGTIRLYQNKIPMFQRIDGEFHIHYNIEKMTESPALEALMEGVKINALSYAYARCPEFFFKDTPFISSTAIREESLFWTSLYRITNFFTGFKKEDGYYMTVNFVLSQSVTADALTILPFTYMDNEKDYRFDTCLWEYPNDWENHMDQAPRQKLYMNARMANLCIVDHPNEFVLPVEIQDAMESEISNNYFMSTFNKANICLYFYTGSTFKPSRKVPKMDPYGYYYIRIKPELGSIFHYAAKYDLQAESFVIKSAQQKLDYYKIKRLVNYHIPPDLSYEEFIEYLKRIRESIHHEYKAHPKWDYIPLQGFDILDNTYDVSDPMIYNMVLRKELFQYTLVWGDYSSLKNANEIDRKHFHNHPEFLGGKTIWIF